MAAWADFLSHGMLEGTCLGEDLCTLSDDQDNINNDTDEGTTSNSDREDLDSGSDDHGRDRSFGPVDGPPILSEVTLAVKKGIVHSYPP